jgi:hypothetical protein
MLAAHQTLMRDDPYDGPYAGKFRTQQNWTGGSDYSPRGAVRIGELPAYWATLTTTRSGSAVSAGGPRRRSRSRSLGTGVLLAAMARAKLNT